MTARDSNIANFYETTLSASMGPTDTTATVVTTSGGPSSPCYVIIEPESASQREIIYMDGTFTSTTFVTSSTANRYLDGSAAGSGLTHPSGSVVWVAVVAQHIEDIHDRIDAVSDHGTLTGLGDDDHTQYLNTSRHNVLDHTTALGTASISDLADVDTTGASSGDPLVFDGTSWEASPLYTSGVHTTDDWSTGETTITHGLGTTPSAVMVTAVAELTAVSLRVLNVGATTFDVRGHIYDGTNWNFVTTTDFHWLAVK